MPRDPLGNEIKEGGMVILNFNERPALAQVVQIRPGGLIGRAGDALPVAGLVVFQIIVPVEFQGDELRNVWVLARPSNQDLAAQKMASEVPS